MKIMILKWILLVTAVVILVWNGSIWAGSLEVPSMGVPAAESGSTSAMDAEDVHLEEAPHPPKTKTVSANKTVAEPENKESAVLPDTSSTETGSEAIRWVTVEETVWTTTDVNVRTGPGVEYSGIGVLSLGASVQRIGTGDNGWSKVIYGGDIAYMNSNYLSTTRPAATYPSNFVGRWRIPDVGIDVACYASNDQSTVDNPDSAAFYFGSGHSIIADHNNQGFEAMKACVTGTMAYLDTPDGTAAYRCVAVIQGHNTGNQLTDENYNSIRQLHPGTLVNYTCNENWQNITIAFFAQT